MKSRAAALLPDSEFLNLRTYVFPLPYGNQFKQSALRQQLNSSPEKTKGHQSKSESLTAGPIYLVARGSSKRRATGWLLRFQITVVAEPV